MSESRGSDWNDARYFLALFQTRALAPAARMLGVNTTTVGRRLTALEQRLGARLFDRTPEGLVPTETALALLPHAQAAEAALLAFERQRSGVDARLVGEVRLATTEIFGPLFLLPRLDAFRRQYPELRISLQVSTRMMDLARREADVALRMTRPSEKALIARKLGVQAVGAAWGSLPARRRGTISAPSRRTSTSSPDSWGSSAMRSPAMIGVAPSPTCSRPRTRRG